MKSILIISIIFLVSSRYVAQIPQRAIDMADSICQSRIVCSNTKYHLFDSILYPIETGQQQEETQEYYFFNYEIQIRKDISINLRISLNEDNTIKSINGASNSLRPLLCEVLPRKETWKIAKENGLRSGYRKSSYEFLYYDDKVIISYRERHSRYDIDNYRINAITGEFIRHRKMNFAY